MFQIDVPIQPFFEPWDLSLPERLRMLSHGDAGTLRVAYFYEEPNNSTFRYRAYNMVEALNRSKLGKVAASYFFLKDLYRLDEIADLADVLVVCRSRYELHLNQLITKFKSKGRRVLFDVDDLVFDPRCVHMIMNTLAQDTENPALWDYWFAYTSRMEQALALCDGAITTNEYLAKCITDKTCLPVFVVPNFMNKEQVDLSNRIFEDKASNGFFRHNPITFGYFSGSPSHPLDFAIVEEALFSFMSTHLDVRLVVAGYIETGERLFPFAKRIHYEPFQDYVNLQRLIASVDFNLMPLQSNVFTNCKSELKYFEAAAVGTLSIASPTYTYARAIEDGVNGRLAKAHEWAQVFEQLLRNPETYADMAHRAWSDIQVKYTWSTQSDAIMSALGGLLDYKPK